MVAAATITAEKTSQRFVRKDSCGKDSCGKHHGSGMSGSKPPKEYMGGSVYSPPRNPGNPVMPSKPTFPKTPIKYYGLKNSTLASSLLNQHKDLTPREGQDQGKAARPTHRHRFRTSAPAGRARRADGP